MLNRLEKHALVQCSLAWATSLFRQGNIFCKVHSCARILTCQLQLHLQLFCSPLASKAGIGGRQVASQLPVPFSGQKAPNSGLDPSCTSMLMSCLAIMDLTFLVCFCAAQGATAGPCKPGRHSGSRQLSRITNDERRKVLVSGQKTGGVAQKHVFAETYGLKDSCNRDRKDGNQGGLQAHIPFKTGDTLFVKHMAAAEQHLFFHAKMLTAD